MSLLAWPLLIVGQPSTDGFDKRIRLRSRLGGVDAIGNRSWMLERFADGLSRMLEPPSDFADGQTVDEDHAADEFELFQNEHLEISPERCCG